MGLTRLLLVEDDAQNIAIIEALLEDICNITSFENGQDAIAAIKSGQLAYDVALVDLHLQSLMEEDGIEVIRASQQRYSNVRVIAMAGCGSKPSCADYFLAKPFSFEELKQAIAEAIKH